MATQALDNTASAPEAAAVATPGTSNLQAEAQTALKAATPAASGGGAEAPSSLDLSAPPVAGYNDSTATKPAAATDTPATPATPATAAAGSDAAPATPATPATAAAGSDATPAATAPAASGAGAEAAAATASPAATTDNTAAATTSPAATTDHTAAATTSPAATTDNTAAATTTPAATTDNTAAATAAATTSPAAATDSTATSSDSGTQGQGGSKNDAWTGGGGQIQPGGPIQPAGGDQGGQATGEVSRQDNQLNQEVNQDLGKLNGNYGNLEKSVDGIQSQIAQDSSQPGGMTSQEQQQLNQQETGVLTQMNHDFAAAAPAGSFDAEHPRQGQIFNEASALTSQINDDKGHLDGQYGQLKGEIQGVTQQDKSDAQQNGGFITLQQQQQLNNEENHIEGQINHDYADASPAGSFDADHPRQAQVLNEDQKLQTEIQSDKGDLSGNYSQLMSEAQQIGCEDHSDAKQNGGFITRAQESAMMAQEDSLQRQINRSDTLDQPDKNSVQSGESIWGDPHLKASDGSSVGDQIAANQDVLLLQTKNGVSITGKTTSYGSDNSDGVPITVFSTQQVNLGDGKSVQFNADGSAYEIGADGCKQPLTNGQTVGCGSDTVTYKAGCDGKPASLAYNFSGCGDGSIAGTITANSGSVDSLSLDVDSSKGSDFGGMLASMDSSFSGVTANAQSEKTGQGYFIDGKTNKDFYINSLSA